MSRNPKDKVDTKFVGEQYKFELVDSGRLIRQAYKYDILDDESAYMLIKVGDKYPHMILNALADGDLQIEIYHTPTVTLDGTEEPSGNFNFNSSLTSDTTWFPTPTIDIDGTYIGNVWVLGGSGGATPAGAESAAALRDFNIILIPNTNFLLKFNNSADREIQLLFEAVYTETEHGHV